MGILSNLEPGKVFRYFEEITRIPHGSGNVEQISNYLADFARQRNLFCIQDHLKNIIIIKEATPGYEDEPVIILQGHMDMVAVKKPDCDIDMLTEGLRIGVDGDRIYAEGTSLGGDDGIAVAYALALLDSEELKHPKLEVILTVDEEVGMDGARGIDLSMLTGNRMINLDSEEEGIFLTSCAGGARIRCHMPLSRQLAEGRLYQIKVSGLLGGHSGAEIHKERGNSNCLMARILSSLCRKLEISLVELKGGLADNAIPRETLAKVMLSGDKVELFEQILTREREEIREELATKDPGFELLWERLGDTEKTEAVTPVDTRRAAAFLLALPMGVQAMSADMPGLVETSLNMGVLELSKEGVCAEFAVRSSVESAKRALLQKLCAVVELAGGDYSISGDYPGWKYRKNSPLRDKMVRLYAEMYGEEPRVEAIHAGLECGILGSKLADLDCVSLGPDMADIHTTEETLSIASTRRVWEYLVKLLETK